MWFTYSEYTIWTIYIDDILIPLVYGIMIESSPVVEFLVTAGYDEDLIIHTSCWIATVKFDPARM